MTDKGTARVRQLDAGSSASLGARLSGRDLPALGRARHASIRAILALRMLILMLAAFRLASAAGVQHNRTKLRQGWGVLRRDGSQGAAKSQHFADRFCTRSQRLVAFRQILVAVREADFAFGYAVACSSDQRLVDRRPMHMGGLLCKHGGRSPDDANGCHRPQQFTSVHKCPLFLIHQWLNLSEV